MVETIATGLGHVTRVLLTLLRVLPGVAGPLAIVYGLWLYDLRIAIIAGGVVLILADLRIGRFNPTPDEPQ